MEISVHAMFTQWIPMKSVSLKTKKKRRGEKEEQEREEEKGENPNIESLLVSFINLISRASYKRKEKKCKADAKLESCSASSALRHDTCHGVPSSCDSWCGLQLQDHGEWSSFSSS